jgi:azurin
MSEPNLATMKKFVISATIISFFSIPVFWITGCGGDETTQQTIAKKPNAADLFTDDRPVYDNKAINPDAEVITVDLKATGTSMADMSYDQKTITVRSGTTVKLKFINTAKDAAMPHNWVLVYFGTMEKVATAGISAGKEGSYVPDIRDVLIATRLLGPEEETEITFPAPPAGKYQFLCTYPGHWSIMNGAFIVE